MPKSAAGPSVGSKHCWDARASPGLQAGLRPKSTSVLLQNWVSDMGVLTLQSRQSRHLGKPHMYVNLGARHFREWLPFALECRMVCGASLPTTIVSYPVFVNVLKIEHEAYKAYAGSSQSIYVCALYA